MNQVKVKPSTSQSSSFIAIKELNDVMKKQTKKRKSSISETQIETETDPQTGIEIEPAPKKKQVKKSIIHENHNTTTILPLTTPTRTRTPTLSESLEHPHNVKLSLSQAQHNATLILSIPSQLKSKPKSASRVVLKPRKKFASLDDALYVYFVHFVIERNIPFIEISPPKTQQRTTPAASHNDDGATLMRQYGCELCLDKLFTLSQNVNTGECEIKETVRKHKCSPGILISNHVPLLPQSTSQDQDQDQDVDVGLRTNYELIFTRLQKYGSVYLPYFPFIIGLRSPRFGFLYRYAVRFFLDHRKLFLPKTTTIKAATTTNISANDKKQITSYHPSFTMLYSKLYERCLKLDDLQFLDDLIAFSGLSHNEVDFQSIKQQWRIAVDLVVRGNLSVLTELEKGKEDN